MVDRPDDNVTVRELLDRLQELVLGGRRVPLTRLVMLDETTVVELLDELRRALPAELGAARRLLAQRDEVLAVASQQAAAVLNEAEERAAALAEGSEVSQRARSLADEVVRGAEATARELREGANRYADEVLAALEERLATVLGELQAGRRELAPPSPDQAAATNGP